MPARTPSAELIPAWRALARWAVPIMMTASYCFLVSVADTTNDAKYLLFGGLFLVLVTWFIFRRIATQATLARALAVGDAAELRRVVDEQLARRVTPRLLVYKALACELAGDWAATLEMLGYAGDPGDAQLVTLGVAARIAALVETGDVRGARAVFDIALAPSRAIIGAPRDVGGPTDLIVRLAEGRIVYAEGADATALLSRIVDDVRAGSAMRATAHHYLARTATRTGDAAAAARHAAEAVKLAPASWLASDS